MVRSLLDVNLLIALHDPQHVHHTRAVTWFEGDGHRAWASCPLTQNGCLRVMCQPSYTHPWSVQDIAPVLAASFTAPQHQFWPDAIGLLDKGRLRLDRVHGHRQLTDIYLLMLAVHHGGRLVTFDARMPLSAVVGAEPGHLLTLA